MQTPTKKPCAFTLIRLLVRAIIAILAALLLRLAKANKAQGIMCLSNLKQQLTGCCT
jgi:type II secretory pathway pseudopilin PulG